ncbi:hypothetical protein [Candidimonas nitroreducens]|nr:hypothetical protein [Candidimonas nitroreducens]
METAIHAEWVGKTTCVPRTAAAPNRLADGRFEAVLETAGTR